MSVELEPPELGFKRTSFRIVTGVEDQCLVQTGPFQHEVNQVLRLKNPHSDPVAFKVSDFFRGMRCKRFINSIFASL